MEQSIEPVRGNLKTSKIKKFWNRAKNQKVLMLMSLPFVIWLFVFKYIPLFGWTMAFQDYNPALGFFDQEWVGFKHFKVLFDEPLFYQSLKNTIGMGVLGLVFGTISSIGRSEER